MKELGAKSTGPGRVYFTGGATAVLYGWRGTTADIDLKLDPEPDGAFAAIPKLKDALDVNVELASPDQFIPAVPGWQGRSIFVETAGQVDFYHFDLISQALAKIERGHTRDLADVSAMVERDLVDPRNLLEHFEAIVPLLVRYPAVDAEVFRGKVLSFVERDV